jgi:3-phosphoshikimate 1-carboxyvinyltransferase
MSELALQSISAPDATLSVPGSKSFTNRALICAALADGESKLVGWLDSEDTRVMIESLGRLGVEVEERGAALHVRGVGGKFAIPLHPLDCGASGTTMRFLTALATLVPGRVVLDGSARMRERPIQPLAEALSALGASVHTVAGCPPVTVQGGSLPGGEVTIDSSQSSQFLSALLMVAPMSENGVRASSKAITSRPYVDMTVDTMRAFGIATETPAEQTFRVSANQRYRPRTYKIEPDASAATYFFAAAAITGGRVKVEGLTVASTQPDVRFVEVLERMGCAVDRGVDSISVRGPRYLHGIDVDLNALPDSALTLAVVACLAHGQTRIRNVWNLRVKETDRMAALECELEKLGANVKTTKTDVIIDPPERIKPARIATYEDHRMAMSFAIAGLAVDGIVIENPDCVAKTFPDFFERLSLLS